MSFFDRINKLLYKNFHNVIFISKLTLTNKQPRTSPSKNINIYCTSNTYTRYTRKKEEKDWTDTQQYSYADKNGCKIFSYVFSSLAFFNNDKHFNVTEKLRSKTWARARERKRIGNNDFVPRGSIWGWFHLVFLRIRKPVFIVIR